MQLIFTSAPMLVMAQGLFSPAVMQQHTNTNPSNLVPSCTGYCFKLPYIQTIVSELHWPLGNEKGANKKSGYTIYYNPPSYLMLVCNNSRHHGTHAAHKSVLQATELLVSSFYKLHWIIVSSIRYN